MRQLRRVSSAGMAWSVVGTRVVGTGAGYGYRVVGTWARYSGKTVGNEARTRPGHGHGQDMAWSWPGHGLVMAG